MIKEINQGLQKWYSAFCTTILVFYHIFFPYYINSRYIDLHSALIHVFFCHKSLQMLNSLEISPFFTHLTFLKSIYISLESFQKFPTSYLLKCVCMLPYTFISGQLSQLRFCVYL